MGTCAPARIYSTQLIITGGGGDGDETSERIRTKQYAIYIMDIGFCCACVLVRVDFVVFVVDFCSRSRSFSPPSPHSHPIDAHAHQSLYDTTHTHAHMHASANELPASMRVCVAYVGVRATTSRMSVHDSCGQRREE